MLIQNDHSVKPGSIPADALICQMLSLRPHELTHRAVVPFTIHTFITYVHTVHAAILEPDVVKEAFAVCCMLPQLLHPANHTVTSQ